ncbi:MAG: filament integrity protein FraC [Phormidesmis sp.]
MEYEPILPLRAIAFQVLFLMVAVAIEAGILRQRLDLKFKSSVQYATAINLAAVVVGWLFFLAAEPLSPPAIKAQIISYVLFDRLFLRGWTTQLGGAIFAIGLIAFFVTFAIKAKGLELMMRSDGEWEKKGLNQTFRLGEDNEKGPQKRLNKLPRELRYARARQGRTEMPQAISTFTDAVIQANAASFSAVLVLLLLRVALGRFV